MSLFPQIVVRMLLVLLLSLSGLVAVSMMINAQQQVAMDQGNNCANYCLLTQHFVPILPAATPQLLLAFASVFLYMIALPVIALSRQAQFAVAAQPRPSPPLYKLAVSYLH
jgi:hypothetical protein